MAEGKNKKAMPGQSNKEKNTLKYKKSGYKNNIISNKYWKTWGCGDY